MSLIEINQVNKSLKGLMIFENLNFNVKKGKTYGIIGPNGSGKSVLFKLICGFMFPDSGKIIVKGEELGTNKRFPSNFGIIIDRPGYIAGKTGFENLKALAMINNKINDERIKLTMQLLGLQPDAKQKVKNYSLGMKQKLAIAQAIMEDQQTLILDEPFNALDEDSLRNIRQLLLEFKKEGKTILLTSHNREDIELICDEVYKINNYQLERVTN
ncbi:ATP-binding cassette domain-containing protein [Caldifermentibacillus hisashii]|uniref:ATP-binding cassette domain-containing protein n=2 Tax=Caldifermentibacillus hisashii TaxID=996558 RepID=A0ABU9JT10_9BACI